jgi:O-antigen ligase
MATWRASGNPTSWVAATACAAIGVSAMLGVSSFFTQDFTSALAAGVIGGLALGVVVTLGWADPLGPLVLVLPLPAVYASGDVRVPAALVAALIIVTGWGLSRGLDRRPLVAHPASVRSVALLTLAVLVAAAFADEPVAAARESLNFILYLGVFLVATDLVTSSPGRAEAFARWAAWGAATAGIAAVLETVGFLPGRFRLAGTGLIRAAGGFGWPNELAMFLAISLPLAVYNLRVAGSHGGRLLAGSSIVAVALGLVVTFSRGSWVAVASAPAILFLVRERKLALRFFGAALLLGLVIDLGSGGALSARLASTAGDVLVAQRLLLTGAGLLMFQANPIVGVGPGGFGEALEAFGPQISGLFDFVGSAHNGYVHVAAEMGILGLTAFFYFVVSTLYVLARSARRPSRPAARSGLAVRSLGETRNRHRRRALRVALLWAFTTACIVTLFEWPFAHGVGELIMLVAAVGRAQSFSVSAQ